MNEKFRWQIANHRFDRNRRSSERPKPADKLVVCYQIRVTAGERIIKELNSSFEIPEVHDRGYLSSTVADFPQLFDILVAKPLATAVALHQMEEAECCPEDVDQAEAGDQNTQEAEIDFKAPQLPSELPANMPPPPDNTK
jgi:hypothetical protein